MKKFNEEHAKFIRENAVGISSEELTNLLNAAYGTNYKKSQISAYKSNHKIRSGYIYKCPDERKLFPNHTVNFIRENAKGLTQKELTKLVNSTLGTKYTVEQIENMKGRYHISSGLTGHFEKGHIPKNKGTKMIAEVYKKCAATMFKKGHIPKNYREVGSERITKDGYTKIKIADPNKWKLKHIFIWEKNYGPKPDHHCIIFLDGNKQNFALSNLKLITRNENARLNQKNLRSEFPGVTEANITIVKLKSTIIKRRKNGRSTCITN